MHEAQGSQWLDEDQLVAIKPAHLLVTIKQTRQLEGALRSFAGQQHPEILNGWPHACIIQIHEVRPRPLRHRHIGWRPEYVANVAVAVQAQAPRTRMATQGRMLRHHRQRLVTTPGPKRLHLQANGTLRHQKVARRLPHGRKINGRPMHEVRLCSDIMHAGEKTPRPFKHLGIFKLGRTPATTRADRVKKICIAVQSGATQLQRGNDRDLGLAQLGSKGMLLENLLPTPTPGPIELDDHRTSVLQTGLIDTVLVRTESLQPPIAGQPQRFESVHHTVRSQGVVRVH